VIICPGTQIMSALASNSSRRPDDPSMKYVRLSGTSMAAPVATGLIALMFEKQPTLTTAMIKTILSTSARRDSETGSVPNNSYGYGKADALSALNQLPFTEATDMFVGSGIAVEIATGCSKPDYQKQQFDWLQVTGDTTLFASPDCTFQAVKETLKNLANGGELLIAIYDFSVDYVEKLIKGALDKEMKVKLMIDKDSRTGSAKS
jgi:hypothetical protein